MPLVDVVNITVWYQLKPYLPLGTAVTSVRRSAKSQFDFIVTKASKHGYKFERSPTLSDPSTWEGALNFIRKKGYKVAAPGKSNHESGIAYDLSGPDLAKIEAAVRRAVADGVITLSGSKSSILVERENHCVHVEIVGAVIHNEAFDILNTA